MQRPDALVQIHNHQQPFDLAPVTEMHMIAQGARGLGAFGCFDTRAFAKIRQQLARLFIGLAIGNIGKLHPAGATFSTGLIVPEHFRASDKPLSKGEQWMKPQPARLMAN